LACRLVEASIDSGQVEVEVYRLAAGAVADRSAAEGSYNFGMVVERVEKLAVDSNCFVEAADKLAGGPG
jgi:hypothetical protein